MGKISYSNLEEVWGKNYNIINNQNDRNELNIYSEVNYDNSKKSILNNNKNKIYESNHIFNTNDNNESENEFDNEDIDEDEKYLRNETEDLFNEFKLYLKKNKKKLNKELKETFNNKNDSLHEKSKDINTNNIKFEFIDIFILFIIGIILIIIMDSFVKLGKRMNK